MENPIRPDSLDGNSVLYGLWNRKFLFFCFRRFAERFTYRHPSFSERFLRLRFFLSRWLGISAFPLAGKLLSFSDGVLHGVEVEIVGFKHQLFGIEKFRLEPGPSRLFGGHAVVFEKAAGCKGSGPENAHPAHFLAADQRTQAEVQSNRHAYSQQRTDELPGREPEEDGLLIIPDFLWHFDFDKKPAPLKIG